MCFAYSSVLESSGSYGADAFLAKPFDLAELLQKVKHLVNKPGLNEVAIAS
jgi:DNA-binding response OmpR family regulator